MSFDAAPTQWPEPLEWCRRIARVTNALLQGKTNNTGTVTLAANAAGTTVVLAAGRLGTGTAILFDPLTATAAAELAAGTMYVLTADRDVTNKEFTITHANNAQVDRSYRFVLVG